MQSTPCVQQCQYSLPGSAPQQHSATCGQAQQNPTLLWVPQMTLPLQHDRSTHRPSTAQTSPSSQQVPWQQTPEQQSPSSTHVVGHGRQVLLSRS
jgi:hypothetical protein